MKKKYVKALEEHEMFRIVFNSFTDKYITNIFMLKFPIFPLHFLFS